MKKFNKYSPREKEPELYLFNETITVPEVMVIGPQGQIGNMPTQKAKEMAAELELDLVLVGPKATPPVAKIMDYKSFKYQKEKEARKNKAASKKIQIKTLKLSPRIGIGDIETRLNQAVKFIKNGDKVRIEIFLRGREKAHADVGFEVVKKFIEDLKLLIPIKVESPVKKVGSIIESQVAPAAQS